MKFGREIFRLATARHTPLLAVAIGGAAGAVLRHLTMQAFESQIPAILACNIAASALIGFVLGIRERVNKHVNHMMTTGFCGGLSVFSGISKNSVHALQSGDYLLLSLDVAGNFALCLLAVHLGTTLALRFMSAHDRRKAARQ